MKIFECIINAHLRKIVSISPNQCGFVRGSGTTDAIQAIRLLLERHRGEKNQPVHMAFLDLEKAFDRMPRDLIRHSLCSLGAPEEYICWIQLLYTNTTRHLTRLDRMMNKDVRRRMGMTPIFGKMREAQLCWYVIRSGDETVAKTAYRLSPPGR